MLLNFSSLLYQFNLRCSTQSSHSFKPIAVENFSFKIPRPSRNPRRRIKVSQKLTIPPEELVQIKVRKKERKEKENEASRYAQRRLARAKIMTARFLRRSWEKGRLNGHESRYLILSVAAPSNLEGQREPRY